MKNKPTIAYFRSGHRYKPQGLSEIERRTKLLKHLSDCRNEGAITDAETARLFDAGIRIMRESWGKE